jgi:sulfate transport system ATP-binding protein
MEQSILHPGDEVYVLIHRIYLFNHEQTLTVENSQKIDPMPVHI